jgi:hypothetical protein
MRIYDFWKLFLISFLLTPICLFLAAVSARAGHGSYLLAKVLFPFAMLLAAAFNSINVLSMVFAISQFPLYGLILGTANKRGHFRKAAVFLALSHSLAVSICLLIANENF